MKSRINEHIVGIQWRSTEPKTEPASSLGSSFSFLNKAQEIIIPQSWKKIKNVKAMRLPANEPKIVISHLKIYNRYILSSDASDVKGFSITAN